MAKYSILYIICWISTIVVHCLTYALYLVSINKAGVKINLVKRSEAASFQLYPTEISPDSWCQTVWQIFYPFQFGWLFNMLFQFGKEYDERNQYRLPYLFNILYSLGIGLQIPRFVLLGHDHNLASFFMAFFSAVLLVAACVVKAWKLAVPGKVENSIACRSQTGCESKNADACNGQSSGPSMQKWRCCWIFGSSSMFNMITSVAVWSSFYALVTLATVLAHSSPVHASPKDAATGCLCVFLILLIVHIVLDLALFDSYARYQFFSYVYSILAMACVLSNRYKADSRNTMLTLAILIFASVSLMAKVIICCVREILEHNARQQSRVTPEIPQQKV